MRLFSSPRVASRRVTNGGSEQATSHTALRVRPFYRLSPDGVFLLEDGVELFLWVGRAADPAVVSALFGVSSVEGVDLARLQLQVTD